ncbi:MAG: hypothetical protein A2W91_02545 [Bacteroidetes bacterium GWF2_38_335]|nr:MAG: hypothetical protein A2W91_02545 [Bacteroidetes bacterium GWF2_38_335]OFY80726.1 MAG: hypothetical protein A2281_05560 [Bacteroidetes bacterium RIFOXYA12_FULL_38_20]HBS87073.1 hypothetical protein [Bacteroidales bacterium]
MGDYKKIVAIFLILISFQASAQFNFGMRGGLNANKYILENDLTVSENARFGFAGGMFFRVQSKFFTFQPEVMFSQKNGQYSYADFADGVDTLFKNNFNFVDIPFQFGVTIGKTVRLNTGPVFNLLLKEKVNYTIYNSSDPGEVIDDVSNTINVAWQFGVGIEIKAFVFDVHYEYSLNKVMHTFQVPGTPIRLNPEGRNSLWQFTVGFKFLKD